MRRPKPAPIALLALLVAAALALAAPAGARVPAHRAATGAAAARAAAAVDPAVGLRARLSRAMRAAGSQAGAYVRDATRSRTLFGWRASTPRVLASNTKLFTTAAVLRRLGAGGTLRTSVLGIGSLDGSGAWNGDLYLRGGGDPTFGSAAFVTSSYGTGATVEDLAANVAAAGVKRVTGQVFGDESRFDSLRGGPSSGYGVSYYVGPLSALDYNRGLANAAGTAFQSNPPAFAAARLTDALRRRGIAVAGAARAGVTPSFPAPIASVSSPPVSRLLQLTNKESDNFFAEELEKDLGATATGTGSTAAGAQAATAFARRLGASASLVDGSGLSRSDRSSPASVAGLLDGLRSRRGFGAFFDSLPIAGRDGTLASRMRGTAAQGRCRAKTGTLSDVSSLSGYCRSAAGHTIVFSILMNGVDPVAARRLQDRMATALAAYGG